MNHFMNYFMQGYLVDDGEGKLKLRDGADREGHFEDNQGAGPRLRVDAHAAVYYYDACGV